MNALIQILINRLEETLLLNIKHKEKKNFLDEKLDILSTLFTIKKNEKDYYNIFEQSAITKENLLLEILKEDIDEALEKKYIKYGNGLSKNKLFITHNGIYYFYNLNSLDIQNTFKSIDELKFPENNLKLKASEKLFCIFLIIIGAVSEKTKLDISSFDSTKFLKYFEFLKTIENELTKNNIQLGEKVKWGQGKNVSFKGLLGNNVDLNKTGVYQSVPGKYYWLNLEGRRNIKFMLDLILNLHVGHDRITANNVLYKTLWTLSNNVLTDLGEIPNPLSDILINELN